MAFKKGAISAKELKWGLILMVVASFLSGSFLIGIAYENLSDLLAFAGLGILAIVAHLLIRLGQNLMAIWDWAIFLY